MKTVVILLVSTFMIILQGYATEAGQRPPEDHHTFDPDSCNLSPETGKCKKSISKWHYDSAENECKTFTYGGCGGNDNKFHSKWICERRCKPRAIPNTNACPQIECPDEHCSTGYATDSNGCTTCDCRPAASVGARSVSSSSVCPPVCMMYCPYGNKKDAAQCAICECNTIADVCGVSVQCRMECPNGRKTDDHGCPKCECRSADVVSTTCSRVNCKKTCPNGFRRGADNCEICVCASRRSSALRAAVNCDAQPSCNMYCADGFVKRANGCNACRCARKATPSVGHHHHHSPPAPAVPAQLPAVSLQSASVAAAQVPAPGRCQRRSCKKFCPNGFTKDQFDCNTCVCAAADPCAAPRPMCLMHCENGMKKGSDGCDICECQ